MTRPCLIFRVQLPFLVIKFFSTMRTLVFLLFIHGSALAQAFVAETGDIYLGESKGNYYGVLSVKSGVLKKSEFIEIYSNNGFKYLARITKIKNLDTKQELNELKSGQDGFVDFYTADESKSYDDAIRKGYKIYPKGFNPDVTTLHSAESKRVDFVSVLDGKPFNAAVTYKGATLWRKGVKNFAYNKPYLLLQFASIQSPDDRVMSIQVFNPKESPSKYSVKDMEVNFSGAVDGKKENTTIYGFVNGKADTDFILEITKWHRETDTKAIISGKIYGELREVKILGVPKKLNRFENGSFENIEVEIMNTQPDVHEMMKTKN